MLIFDPADPYPLVPDASRGYAEAQVHSEQVDRWLGLETEKVERQIQNHVTPHDQNLWIGLPAKTLLTPYTEIRRLLEDLRPAPGDVFVDLGAAYGRMGFVLARHFPEVRFIGYEMV